jgi:hypothetical protein
MEAKIIEMLAKYGWKGIALGKVNMLWIFGENLQIKLWSFF